MAEATTEAEGETIRPRLPQTRLRKKHVVSYFKLYPKYKSKYYHVFLYDAIVVLRYSTVQ